MARVQLPACSGVSSTGRGMTRTLSTRWPSISTTSKRNPPHEKWSVVEGTRPSCCITKPLTVVHAHALPRQRPERYALFKLVNGQHPVDQPRTVFAAHHGGSAGLAALRDVPHECLQEVVGVTNPTDAAVFIDYERKVDASLPKPVQHPQRWEAFGNNDRLVHAHVSSASGWPLSRG